MDKPKKIQVKICMGTTCHVMGGGELHRLKAILSDQRMGFVELTGCNCLGLCKDHKHRKAPYALVDGEVICEATVVKVLTRLTEIVQGRQGGGDHVDE